MLTIDFIWGFAAGLGLAILVGWFMNLYRGWLRTRNSYGKPQIVIQPTNKTPEQVGDEASAAARKILLVWCVVLCMGWIVLELFFPNVARTIRWAFGDLLSLFLGE